MIKINLVREGRAVRGAGVAPAAVATGGGARAGGTINNMIIIACVVLAVIGGVVYWLWQKRELGQRQEIVAQRTAEADKLDAIIKEVDDYQRRRESLQQRIDLINQLKQNQKGPVRIMDQISRDLPDLVWLDSMDLTGRTVSLTGRGLNPNAIALFIENIKNDPYFEEPQVGSVTQISANPLVYSFDMKFAFTYQPKGQTATAGATPAAAAAPGAAAAQ